MLEERYKQISENIHADEVLIDRTLDAIEASNTPRPRYASFRVAVSVICAIVLIVAACVNIVQPPRDIVASDGENLTESTSFIPFSSTPVPKDIITVTAGTATIDAEGIISIPLTIKGDALVNQVLFDFTDHHSELIAVSHESDFLCYAISAGEFQITKKYRLQEGKSLDDLGENLSFSLSEITVFRNAAYVLHWLMDLNSLPFSRMQTCEANTSVSWWKVPENSTPGPEHIQREVIQCLAPSNLNFDLGCGICITGLGFNDDNAFMIQMCVPMSLPMGSSCIAQLVHDIDGERRLLSGEHLGWWNDSFTYVYHQFTFPEVNPDNLHEYRLETGITPISDIIAGEWPIIIPVSEIQTAE